MNEIKEAIYVCTRCGRMFYGTPEEGNTSLPCGHIYGIAASPVMVIRDLVLAGGVWDLVGDEVAHHNILDVLKDKIND